MSETSDIILQEHLIMANRMSPDLQRLLNTAAKTKLTESDKEEQRRSFAYGNAKIENAGITRQMVDTQAEKMASGN